MIVISDSFKTDAVSEVYNFSGNSTPRSALGTAATTSDRLSAQLFGVVQSQSVAGSTGLLEEDPFQHPQQAASNVAAAACAAAAAVMQVCSSVLASCSFRRRRSTAR